MAFQGIRLSQPTLGETFVVSGLGLIGLLTAQLLKANGCIVLGLDPDPAKCDLALELGIKALDLSSGIDPVSFCLRHTNGIGVDGVLITAATSSSDPVHVGASLPSERPNCFGWRYRLGVATWSFLQKELSFQVSCSYGPGRYDSSYEKHSHDYPIGFVRWTEQRNFHAVLQSLASRRFVHQVVDFSPLSDSGGFLCL